jgi:hypothetical protein
MSVFDTLAAQSLAPFLTDGLGEAASITPKGGSATAVTIIVLRDKLQTRATDGGSQPQYELQIQIPMAEYPGGTITPKGDTVDLFVRKGDTVKSRRTIAAILGQVGAMWILGVT